MWRSMPSTGYVTTRAFVGVTTLLTSAIIAAVIHSRMALTRRAECMEDEVLSSVRAALHGR